LEESFENRGGDNPAPATNGFSFPARIISPSGADSVRKSGASIRPGVFGGMVGAGVAGADSPAALLICFSSRSLSRDTVISALKRSIGS